MIRRNRSVVSEPGFTVVELVITMAITMTVLAALLGIVVSQSNAERRLSTFADNQEELRQAIVALQRDVRSAAEMTPLAASSQYALRVDLMVYDTPSNPPSPIRWTVDTATQELRREVLDSGGVVIATSHRLKGVTNTAALPLFTFYAADQVAFDLSALSSDPPEDIAECAARIHITIVAAPTAGPSPARLESDAEFRNRGEDAGACSTAPPTP